MALKCSLKRKKLKRISKNLSQVILRVFNKNKNYRIKNINPFLALRIVCNRVTATTTDENTNKDANSAIPAVKRGKAYVSFDYYPSLLFFNIVFPI